MVRISLHCTLPRPLHSFNYLIIRNNFPSYLSGAGCTRRSRLLYLTPVRACCVPVGYPFLTSRSDSVHVFPFSFRSTQLQYRPVLSNPIPTPGFNPLFVVLGPSYPHTSPSLRPSASTTHHSSTKHQSTADLPLPAAWVDEAHCRGC